MTYEIIKSNLAGSVFIPGSKSHTIRALFFSSLASGKSIIKSPLYSEDTKSAINICKALGAKIDMNKAGEITVEGFGGRPHIPEDVLDVGNSGTTLRIALATAALGTGISVFTGDHQIRKRPLGPLLEAINNLGGKCYSTRKNGLAPIVVEGCLKGGYTELEAISSQYLSALLINLPVVEKDSEIVLTILNEVPYVDITLWWLDKLGIKYINRDYKSFKIFGKQKYHAFTETIPGDFSSATFFAVLAAISGNDIEIQNLDMTDPQGDKKVLDMLEKMGADVKVAGKKVTVKGNKLKGMEFDLNATPDALPAMAIAGCFAEGETRLINVPQARLKETDRIAVMKQELTKLGADIKELPDGLVIRRSTLTGTKVQGHYDHRVVMALAIAGLCIDGKTVIDTAEAVSVTFPGFTRLIEGIGGKVKTIN